MIGRWRIAAATLAMSALVGCTIGLVPSPSTAPIASTAPTASPPISSATSGPTTSIEPATGWRLVTPADPVDAATFSDVIFGPDGFVVAGAGGPIGVSAIALHSVDGVDWSSEPIDGSFAAPSSLGVVGAQVVAVGGGQTNRCGHPAALSTWVRNVAGAWREAPFDPVFCAGPGNATLLAFDGHAVLLGAGVGDVPFSLTSDDGLHWSAEGRDPFGDVYPLAAVAHDPDLWLFGTAPDGQPVVVHRSAGRPFDEPVAIAGLGANASILAAVWFDDGPLAVVAVGPAAGLLVRDGGGPWIITDVEGLPADQVSGIVVVDDRLLAFGATEAGVPVAWASGDGSVWQPLALPAGLPPGATIRAVASGGGVAVLVGQIPAPDGQGAVGAIWTGPADLLAS